MAITSNSHLKIKITPNSPPSVHSYEGTDVLNPSEGSITKREHVSMMSSYQKTVPCPISFYSNDC